MVNRRNDMQKKIMGLAVGASLAFAAACAFADAATYYPTDSGYVLDDDGRIYSYVAYGTNEPATPVIASKIDVNTEGRAAVATAPSPANRDYENTAATAVPPEPTVSVRAPDVNEVYGRA
jgi:hypothetical protein